MAILTPESIESSESSDEERFISDLLNPPRVFNKLIKQKVFQSTSKAGEHFSKRNFPTSKVLYQSTSKIDLINSGKFYDMTSKTNKSKSEARHAEYTKKLDQAVLIGARMPLASKIQSNMWESIKNNSKSEARFSKYLKKMDQAVLKGAREPLANTNQSDMQESIKITVSKKEIIELNPVVFLEEPPHNLKMAGTKKSRSEAGNFEKNKKKHQAILKVPRDPLANLIQSEMLETIENTVSKKEVIDLTRVVHIKEGEIYQVLPQPGP
ncbi:hypothetical protein PGT21_001689 [Puccinia graminis f. sp. tritici]|uniref:Uncharacterized protein n=1 Tax=Puccinia graminis f. sp. tritici TaxID=56615 RepID=A0A5B0PE52_PUCGR|nr:hypothetical protein PGT21_001689 [Puccinia graminis f. sp. tritici]